MFPPESDQDFALGDDGELLSEKFCVHCGSASRTRANYCYNCGVPFEINASVRSGRILRSWRVRAGAFGLLVVLITGGVLTQLNRQFIPIMPPPIIATVTTVAAEPTDIPPTNTPAMFPSQVSLHAIETLPSEADTECLAQLPQDEQWIVSNIHSPETTFGQVAILPLDGSRLCRLTAPTMRVPETGRIAVDILPRWLPDGRIVFNSTRYGYANWQDEVYMINRDGSQFLRLELLPEMMFWQPVWSPDGK